MTHFPERSPVPWPARPTRGRASPAGILLALGLLAAAPLAGAAARCDQVAPAATSSAIEEIYLSPRDHYVCRPDPERARGLLLVFFAGTRAAPSRYSLLMQEAATSGLHAVSLGYHNRFAINLEICPYDDAADCAERSRREILYGVDETPAFVVDRENSGVGRLVSLLRHLNGREPDQGWSRYLDGDGPRWSSLVMSGHSQGAGHATLAARDHAVARLVIFAWTDGYRGDLAPWLRQPFATPSPRLYAFEHVRDRGMRLRREMWEELGMSSFGAPVSVDGAEPPYGGAHVLTTAVEANPHPSVAVDDFTPRRPDGGPAFAVVWRHLLEVVPEGSGGGGVP